MWSTTFKSHIDSFCVPHQRLTVRVIAYGTCGRARVEILTEGRLLQCIFLSYQRRSQTKATVFLIHQVHSGDVVFVTMVNVSFSYHSVWWSVNKHCYSWQLLVAAVATGIVKQTTMLNCTYFKVKSHTYFRLFQEKINFMAFFLKLTVTFQLIPSQRYISYYCGICCN